MNLIKNSKVSITVQIKLEGNKKINFALIFASVTGVGLIEKNLNNF